jgi:diguanylate cyclase (GGDEF)-like protein
MPSDELGEETVNSDATTSRMTVSLMLDYVREQAGDAGVERLLERLAPEAAEVVRHGTGPVSHTVKESLFQAAADILDDPRVGRAVGASILRSSVVTGLAPLVHAFGTVEGVLANLSKISTRFDTAAVLRCERGTSGSMQLVWQVRPPHRAFRADCDYNIGLFTQVPVLFGLEPATVSHTDCQVDGGAACHYTVSWRPRRRLLGRHRTDELAEALTTTTRGLELLQDAAADLVAEGDTRAVLERILQKVRLTVHAPWHVLAVRLADGTLHTLALGVPDQPAGELAARLLAGEPTGGDETLVAEVRSARRRYGALAAVGVPGHEFSDSDRRMLAAYAGFLAAALDTAQAVIEARRQEETARLLLSLAHGLGEAHTVAEVAQTVSAAVPAMAGSDRAAFALWSASTGALTVHGAAGWPPELEPLLGEFEATPAEAPELALLLRTRRPLLLDGRSSAWARGVLTEFGLRALAAVPVLVDDRVLGFVVAHWAETEPPVDIDPVLAERLAGLARQAATALENVRLLEQVRSQALHDPLTGLPNRLLFEERLQAALDEARRTGDRVGVLFCDLNRFKRVNDSLGHAAGDELLRQVADRLRTSLRATDTPARFSGDEFVVLLPELTAEDEAQALAGRLAAALAAPFDLEGTQVFADSAVGVAVGDGRSTPVGLLARADQDMYVAKARVHGPSLAPTRRDPESLALEADLHGAAARGELLLHFQPQFDLVRERVSSVESLVRWRHPVRGLVPPGAFIPLAEESGLIGEIGDWVVQEACATAAGWRRRGFDLTVSVNVAAPQLHDPAFGERVRAVLSSVGLPPPALVLEITESQVVADPMATRRQLQQLRDLGVGVSVDDFGTGYSSLSQLRRLPVTEVKIDRSFIAELDETRGSWEFLEGLVGLARGLRLRVVAEGVETSEQLEVLGRVGCDLAQGFLLSRPLPAEALLEFLEGGLVEGEYAGAAGR